MIQEISNSANSILQQLAVVQFFVKLSMTTSDVISSSQEKIRKCKYKDQSS